MENKEMENTAQPADSSLVTVFRMAEGGIEEMEVLTVQQLLESNGIATVLVGDSPLPNFSEEIRVASEDADRARQLIADALAIGPEGAEEAELNREAELDPDGTAR
jgi:Putative prokaryotic signal transducing protein